MIDDSAPGQKGLKANAITHASNVVIATASTAPAYVLMLWAGVVHRDFFRRRREVHPRR